MKWIKNAKGFTLIEVILAITVIAIALPSLLALFSETAVTVARTDRLPAATTLAVELMEEIKSLKFDEMAEKASDNWSTTLGPDTGEGTNKSLYDDVDDFNGWTQNFSSPFADYSASVSVAYVAANLLNTPLTIPGSVPSNWTPSYKRIIVTVSNAALPADISLTTIVTEAQSL